MPLDKIDVSQGKIPPNQRPKPPKLRDQTARAQPNHITYPNPQPTTQAHNAPPGDKSCHRRDANCASYVT
ncbi:MAG: hypothetical protein ACI81R_001266 [Bradymonadia bacterium]|jgi:hypothetical protein